MTARVLPFPSRREMPGGTIHVAVDRDGGFEVCHESSSGSSWGAVSRYRTGQQAITAALIMNRQYGGDCNLAICDEARLDGLPVKFAILSEDF